MRVSRLRIMSASFFLFLLCRIHVTAVCPNGFPPSLNPLAFCAMFPSQCSSFLSAFFLLSNASKGGTKDCDHWHQGAGFVTSHMGLTLMYEQSLQAVNPAVTVPYWDFTLESTFFGASDFRTSGVFADDWFGEASPGNVRRVC